ncbi:conserved hypothetical protein [Dinoroseobacter shibae DFL 12 = DSM 16493]|jgi:hypothetical protein|uniref:Uncharacterized protein n=2 Tax=root TaxID=1 RepID=A8LKW3_DINSH|nr:MULTISPECIES: DUF6477 family protein [Dinoroseobacter]DBA12220.1 TPA_asm: DUF6477 family protein [Dinogtaviriform tomaschi]ABV93327.1 conserved hypothetical protein [Dinoroseobacter shibae DFL 12 = DSM 16493]MDD9715581.1 DUF6477 family protein [Dinoroseobacter sp. PD6]URF48243.1 DUF6477 family protein [Dinoroseobacter shibae]URF52553.1 DUF6477 family protein [Dinoroseobacter shibae]
MTPLLASLSTLRRPQTLMRAARFGLRDYSRERDLKRLIKKQKAPRPAKALQELMAIESLLEETRQAGQAAYSVARHIEVLAAIMAETRLLPEFMQLDRVG